MNEILCEAKHTKYQPTDDEWKCPICGMGSGVGLIIDYSAECANPECEKLHDEDELTCSCGYANTGKSFAAKIARKNNLVKCACCNGTGLVKKEYPTGQPVAVIPAQ
jgi:hypothetical protein